LSRSRGVLAARNISKSYGDVVVLDPFSLTVGPGTRIGVVGPNGGAYPGEPGAAGGARRQRLILDEPTNHLDLEAIEQLESALAPTTAPPCSPPTTAVSWSASRRRARSRSVVQRHLKAGGLRRAGASSAACTRFASIKPRVGRCCRVPGYRTVRGKPDRKPAPAGRNRLPRALRFAA
jgi:hypothetical protein